MATVRYTSAAPLACPHCGGSVAERLLICPACHGLVHAARLKSLAEQAEAAESQADPASALGFWRSALALLPPDSRQAQVIQQRIEKLGAHVDNAPSSPPPGKRSFQWKQAGGILAAAAFLLWKFKFVIAIVLSKAKLLVLGLTKASTVFSMLLSLGLYWSLWGWKFAAGLVLSIYVHEMGHVAALRKFGIKASAPMFLPGLGAMVRLKQYPATPIEDARVGLAGPFWGLGAALACYAVYFAIAHPFWAAVAKVGAWINLFNLLPVWQLDGARGFRALGKSHRFAVAAIIAILYALTQEGLLILLLIAAAIRAFFKDTPEKSDFRTLIHFALLLASLSLLSQVEAPVAVQPESAPPLLQ